MHTKKEHPLQDTNSRRSGRGRDIDNRRLWARNRYKRKKLEEPEKLLYYGAKRRAKDSEMEFNITVEDIVIPEVCPILLIPLEPGDSRSRKNSPSLDRKDSSIGYVKGNIAVISMKANALKSDLSVEEIERLYKYVSGLQEGD